MAIFHLSAKVISRGKGQSAIAAAAYRSGERLFDEQAEQQKYYPSREERIVFTDIMAPKDAPEWAHDRNALWNQAERAEKRKDAQLAREIEVALPHELEDQQREWLVKDFAREAFVRKGYAVDIAIHAPDRESDGRNHHAHLMITRRTLGPEGFSKTKDWQLDKTQLGAWREQWAHLANRHLERHGHEARIDHRSLKEQGVDREPTVHLGYAANEMAQRGAASDRMDALQGVLARNEIRFNLKAIEAELAMLEEAQKQRRGPSEHGLEWTDKAGMVAQENSAMKAVRNHTMGTALPPKVAAAADVSADLKAKRLARLEKLISTDAKGGADSPEVTNSRNPEGGGRGRTR
jgi:ATP-dependent exoDNAse (exonuclease V) alpha subunit